MARAPASRGIGSALWHLATPPRFNPATPALAGVRYSERRGGIRPLADVYLPEGPGPHPSVVLFHGGAFVIGHRAMKPMRRLATGLVEAGFAVVVFDYPLLFRGGHIDNMLESAAELMAWWRSRADELNLDLSRINAAGLSAGASLCLMHAANEPHAFSRIAAFFGVYDFEYLNGRLAGWMCRLLFRTADPSIWRRYSPLHNCETPAELLLLHGTADVMVPLEHTHRLAEHRYTGGLPTGIKQYEGAPHGFLNHDGWGVAGPSIAEVVAFMRGGL